MVRKKDHSLKFTDSLLIPDSEVILPGGVSLSALADEIFNNPESWESDGTIGSLSDSSDEGGTDVANERDGRRWARSEAGSAAAKNTATTPARTSAPRRSRPPEFILKPFTNQHKLTVQLHSAKGATDLIHWHSVAEETRSQHSPSTILEPSGKDLSPSLKRLSLLFSHGNIFRAFPSPKLETPRTETAKSGPLKSWTPLTVETKIKLPSPRSGSSASSATAASATWGMLHFYAPEPLVAPKSAAIVRRDPVRKSVKPKLPPPPSASPPRPPDISPPPAYASAKPLLSVPVNSASVLSPQTSGQRKVRPLPPLPVPGLPQMPGPPLLPSGLVRRTRSDPPPRKPPPAFSPPPPPKSPPKSPFGAALYRSRSALRHRRATPMYVPRSRKPTTWMT